MRQQLQQLEEEEKIEEEELNNKQSSELEELEKVEVWLKERRKEMEKRHKNEKKLFEETFQKKQMEIMKIQFNTIHEKYVADPCANTLVSELPLSSNVSKGN